MNELGEMFGGSQHSLKLYCRLINKTTISHDEPIKKHIEAFRTFCVANRENILSKNSNFDPAKVLYSSRVFVDMSVILRSTDSETSAVIWKHLLIISALVDPSGKAKEVLRNSPSGKEANFITDIINKVEQNVDPNANPMQAVTSIMQSGIFTDLIGGMNSGLEDGSLDLGKLMGTVSGMISSMGNNSGGQGGEESMNMINTMMGSMLGGLTNNGNSGQSNQQPPGMSDIMSMIASMTNNGNSGQSNQQPPGMSDIMSMLGPLMSSLGDTEDGSFKTQTTTNNCEESVILNNVNIRKDNTSSPKIEELED